jgi:hypothetical protein
MLCVAALNEDYIARMEDVLRGGHPGRGLPAAGGANERGQLLCGHLKEPAAGHDVGASCPFALSGGRSVRCCVEEY